MIQQTGLQTSAEPPEVPIDGFSVLDLRRDDVVIDLTDGSGDRAVLRVAAESHIAPAHGPLRRAVWRLADIAVASILLAMAAPLMAIITALILSRPRGGVLFRQERVGRGGELFTCWKLRTMHADSEARLEHLLEHDPAARREWLATHKLKDDPRITRVGRLLRRTNLDELPQLLNVLGGSMSIVGPRPVVPTETVRYGPDLRRVLSVKPGLTGLWQVSGRNDLDYHQRVAIDVDYVARKGLLLDFDICLRTVGTMLSGRGNGAY